MEKIGGIVLVLTLGILACETPDLRVPSADEVEAFYTSEHPIKVEMRGNVAELTVFQPTAQLRRGGTIWAKVGPYIYLFSQSTEDLFAAYGGLAAVRVVTRTPNGKEVARAMMERDVLNDITWRRALNIAGKARRDGTRHVALLEDLIRWGEDHTTYEYGPAYVRGG